MDNKIFTEAVKKVREISKKRKFDQTFDISINLKQINLKNPEENIDLFLQLKDPKIKKPKICALVDKDLATKAKVFDKVVMKDEFVKYKKDKTELKKLASAYDYFVAQASLMPEIAATFGRVLGPKGKMPNPKAGCVVPPTIEMEPIKARLQNLVRVTTKDQMVVKAPIGYEGLDDEVIIENLSTVFSAVLAALPNKIHNFKSAYLKLTMSPSVKITEKGIVVEEKKEKKSKVEKKEIKVKEKKEAKVEKEITEEVKE
jgi:large subunit ribosomal protein L1